jgi:hypothetical protein
MSHFSVLVCLPADTDPAKTEDLLGDVMEPWNEGLDVEPYRNYEDGGPEDYWWVGAVRRGAEHHRTGTIAGHHRRSVVFGRPDKTDAELREEYADDARWVERLGESPTTWETVVRLYNEKYHPANAVALVGDTDDSSRLNYDAETNRAFTWSTYNPESKWDYWRIGGRWRGYFLAKELKPGLLFAERNWDSPEDQSGLHCDGGPIALLDFEAMRDAAGRKAGERYDRWEAICAKTPSAKEWAHFRSLAELGEISWDDARGQYREQPRIRQAARYDEFKWSMGCLVEEFLPPREEYLANARRGAVPGYALVTLGREWIAPGRMGWFGMSSDGPGERAGYHVAVNAYLDQLDPATVLVVLDCHI